LDADEFRKATCDSNSCWERESFTDAGITVKMGSGWNALMLDRHFSNKHKCLGKQSGARKGTKCDAIGVPEQNQNCRFRLIEAKSGGLSANATRQLQAGADFLQSVIGKCTKVTVTAELFTRDVPSITNKRRASVELKALKRKVPIEIITV
jgi:hypothetical protein